MDLHLHSTVFVAVRKAVLAENPATEFDMVLQEIFSGIRTALPDSVNPYDPNDQTFVRSQNAIAEKFRRDVDQISTWI